MCCRFLFGLEDDEELYGYVEKMEIMYRKLYPSIPFPRGEIFPSDTVCVYLKKEGKITLQNIFQYPIDKPKTQWYNRSTTRLSYILNI